MVGFVVRRLFQTIIVVIIVSILVFAVMRILPGDALVLYIGEDEIQNYSPEQLQEVRHELGIDGPIFTQYINWVSGFAHGDFGTSIAFRSPIVDYIKQRLRPLKHPRRRACPDKSLLFW